MGPTTPWLRAVAVDLPHRTAAAALVAPPGESEDKGATKAQHVHKLLTRAALPITAVVEYPMAGSRYSSIWYIANHTQPMLDCRQRNLTKSHTQTPRAASRESCNVRGAHFEGSRSTLSHRPITRARARHAAPQQQAAASTEHPTVTHNTSWHWL